MKRFCILCLIMAFSFGVTACSMKEPDNSISSNTATSSDISSVVSSVESNTSSVESNTSSVESVSSSQVSSTVVESNIDTGDYIVNDPYNKRRLSTEKHGFGFGVATNEKPHSISVNNQKTFDSMDGVKALALDTISTDKRMYLTFDCGYEYKNLTADILDTLKEKQVKAAFFVTLSYAKNNRQLVRRMIDEGHIVGNHSATHPVFPDISRSEMANELYRVDNYLVKNFNYKTEYFRFPTGTYSENSLELATSVGYKNIFWSVAYGDYDTDNQMGADKAYETIVGRYHPGAVILLHAISQDNADILGDLIDKAHGMGYTFKTLDEYSAFQ